MIPEPNTTLSNLDSLTYFKLIAILDESGLWRDLAMLPETNFKQRDIAHLQNSRFPGSMSEAVLKYLTRYNWRVKHLITCLKKIGAERALMLLQSPESVSICQEPPEFIHVNVGDKLEFCCRAISFPRPNYQWYYKKGIDQKFEALPDEGSEILSIASAGTENAGYYGCLVSNEDETGAPWSETFTRWTHVVVGGNDSIPPASPHKPSPCPSRIFDGPLMSSPLVTFTECKAEDKVALLIGNQSYRTLPKLRAGHKDVQTLASSLSELGFHVIALTDLNLEEMSRAVDLFCYLLGKGVYAVFYFVGHGFEIGGQHYMLPIDAPPHYLRRMCLCAEDVHMRMQKDEGKEPALVFFILDTCRREPEGNTAIEQEKPEIYRPRACSNTLFAYATSFTCAAYEEPGATNGIFVKYLKRRIAQHKSLNRILDQVLYDISHDPKASGKQIPEVTRTLSVDASLADPVLRELPAASDRREIFSYLRKLPEKKEYSMDELGIRASLTFEHVGFFRNAIYVYVSLVGSNRYVPCFSSFEDSPITMDQAYLPQQQNKITVRILLQGLQKLQGDLNVLLNILDKMGDDGIQVVRKCLVSLPVSQIRLINFSSADSAAVATNGQQPNETPPGQIPGRKPVENEDTSLASTSADSGFGSLLAEARGVGGMELTIDEVKEHEAPMDLPEGLPDLNELAGRLVKKSSQ